MPFRINSNIAEDHERRARPRLEDHPNIESSQSSMGDESTLIQTHYKAAPSLSHRALAISEIILLIFSYFTDTDLGVVSFTRVAPVAVSQVNHQWRLLALSFSSLWASFGVMLYGSYFDQTSLRTAEHDIVNLVLVEKWWNRFLDRSRNADLAVIIGSTTTVMSEHTCSLENYRVIRSIIDDTILRHGSRLERLNLFFRFHPPAGHPEKDMCIKDMPRLKWLRFTASSNLNADISPESMPNLTELDCIGPKRLPLKIQAIHVPQTQLLTLSIHVTQLRRETSQKWIILKQLLLLSPYLREMTCIFTFARSPPPSMIGSARTELTLQALQSAQFKFRHPLPGLIRHILDSFELPSLVFLKCEIDAELPDAWAGIEALLLRSQAPLKSLILTHTVCLPNIAKSPRVNDDCILSILRAAPNLENVILQRMEIGDYLRLSVLPKLRHVFFLESAEAAQIELA